jgi:hypothetical protein
MALLKNGATAMAELKTKETDASVDAFLDKIDQDARQDCLAIVKLLKQASHAEPKMWGPGIIGFGKRKLKYASGRELDWMLIGFSPRKGKITLYLPGYLDQQSALLKKLGKHTTGKGCLYIKKLADIDTNVLKELIKASLQNAQQPGA